ncbi:MAG TPA: hypothetical protein VEU51_08060 [Candidatus Acidoferrales bacterium]|nr:hypothetical protein [Candidatus Acidoferrales bacterium]
MPQEQTFVGDGAASTVLITDKETIPGKSYRVLGPVSIDPGAPSMFNRLGASCDNPLNLAKAAIARYGHADAIVDYRTQQGECTPGLSGVGMCSSTCQGSAVVYVDAKTPASSKNSSGSSKPVHGAANPNAEWPESEFGTY